MIWIDQIRIHFIHTVYGKDKNTYRGEGGLEFGQEGRREISQGDSHMKETGILIGNFEFPRKETNLGVVQALFYPFMHETILQFNVKIFL